MNTPNELLRKAENSISGMGYSLDAIEDFMNLVCLVLNAPDLEEECHGLHRLMHVMRKHLDDLREEHIQASCAIRRIANP
jgi:hypothetical protein